MPITEAEANQRYYDSVASDQNERQWYTQAMLQKRLQENQLATQLQNAAMNNNAQLRVTDLNNASQERQNDQHGFYQQSIEAMRNNAALDQGAQTWAKARDLAQVQHQIDMQRLAQQYGLSDVSEEKRAMRDHSLQQDQQLNKHIDQMRQLAPRFKGETKQQWPGLLKDLQAVEEGKASGKLRPEDYLAARQQIYGRLQSMPIEVAQQGELPGDMFTKNGYMFERTPKGELKNHGVDPTQDPAELQKQRAAFEETVMGPDGVTPMYHKAYDKMGGPPKITVLGGKTGTGTTGSGVHPLSKEYDQAYKLLTKIDEDGNETPADPEDIKKHLGTKLDAITALQKGERPDMTRAEMERIYDSWRGQQELKNAVLKQANPGVMASVPEAKSLPSEILRAFVQNKIGLDLQHQQIAPQPGIQAMQQQAQQPVQNLQAPVQQPLMQQQGPAPGRPAPMQQQPQQGPPPGMGPQAGPPQADQPEPDAIQWAQNMIRTLSAKFPGGPSTMPPEAMPYFEGARQVIIKAMQQQRGDTPQPQNDIASPDQVQWARDTVSKIRSMYPGGPDTMPDEIKAHLSGAFQVLNAIKGGP